MPESLQIDAVVSQPFAENTYLLWRADRSDCVIIDPGLEPDLILESLSAKSLTPVALLCTHGHGDHIGGNAALKRAFPKASIMIGEKEGHWLTDANANLSASFGMPITSPPADRLLREGDVIDLAGIRLEVLDLPGHSPGHVVFLYRSEPIIVLAGDTLFQGSIGRSDLPGGNGKLLVDGIRKKLFSLADDTIILPGHGDGTTTGEEKSSNPFVGLFR
jgi:glyoxylase-like metal-dependent hydrolase (beta-lactamase superfamily II)